MDDYCFVWISDILRKLFPAFKAVREHAARLALDAAGGLSRNRMRATALRLDPFVVFYEKADKFRGRQRP